MLDQFILKFAEAKELQRLNTLEHEDTKFHFAYIAFELTRKCNLKCAHCLRGEWQNLTMTKEVIDKMLEVSSGIHNIFFTGGEPFLAPDLIEHIVDRVIALDFDAKYISVITNGTILNSLGIRSVQAMNRFAEWSYKKNGIEQAASITISNDIYHGTTPQEAVDFYSAYVDEKYTKVKIQERNDTIGNAGRAKKNHVATNDMPVVYAYPRRIRITEDNVVPCMLHLSPKGDLTVAEFKTWEEKDANPIGNIMEESLVRMFERNQWSELPCNEVKRLGRYFISTTENKDYQEVNAYMISCYETIRTVRYRLHLRFPYLDYTDIYWMSTLYMEQETKMNWLKVTTYDYDEKVKDKITPEFIQETLSNYEIMNNHYRSQGKKKVQLVPYNPDNKTIENCADLDAQDE